jgi:hypothetical protein
VLDKTDRTDGKKNLPVRRVLYIYSTLPPLIMFRTSTVSTLFRRERTPLPNEQLEVSAVSCHGYFATDLEYASVRGTADIPCKNILSSTVSVITANSLS